MNTEAEIWKAISGYEGIYEVSNAGRVKSLGNNKTRKEKILKSGLNIYGYPLVVLCNNAILKSIPVHTLVACAFLGHTRNGYTLVIDHINGIRSDPRAENLRIVTHRFNLTRCIRKDQDSFSSQYVGVCWSDKRRRWISQIQINGKSKYLGSFVNEVDAANAYQNKLLNATI